MQATTTAAPKGIRNRIARLEEHICNKNTHPADREQALLALETLCRILRGGR